MRINSLVTGMLFLAFAASAIGLFSDPVRLSEMIMGDKILASPRSSHDIDRFPLAPHHTRPLKVVDGRTLLWAGGESKGGEGAIWFDMTDALVDPATFQHGIGKDRIPSIDHPIFAPYGDEKLTKHRIGDETDVIGYEFNGVAKAYPLFILDRHEIVNDQFGDTHLGIYW